MPANPLSVSAEAPQHRDWCPHGNDKGRTIDIEPLAIVECEYAYVMRCRLCGGLALVDFIAKPGWTARITKMEYDPEVGPLVSVIGETDESD